MLFCYILSCCLPPPWWLYTSDGAGSSLQLQQATTNTCTSLTLKSLYGKPKVHVRAWKWTVSHSWLHKCRHEVAWWWNYTLPTTPEWYQVKERHLGTCKYGRVSSNIPFHGGKKPYTSTMKQLTHIRVGVPICTYVHYQQEQAITQSQLDWKCKAIH